MTLTASLLVRQVGVAHHVGYVTARAVTDIPGALYNHFMSTFWFVDLIHTHCDFIGLNYYGQVRLPPPHPPAWVTQLAVHPALCTTQNPLASSTCTLGTSQPPLLRWHGPGSPSHGLSASAGVHRRRRREDRAGRGVLGRRAWRVPGRAVPPAHRLPPALPGQRVHAHGERRRRRPRRHPRLVPHRAPAGHQGGDGPRRQGALAFDAAAL
jgi:hypothetical protein